MKFVEYDYYPITIAQELKMAQKAVAIHLNKAGYKNKLDLRVYKS